MELYLQSAVNDWQLHSWLRIAALSGERQSAVSAVGIFGQLAVISISRMGVTHIFETRVASKATPTSVSTGNWFHNLSKARKMR